MPYRFALVCVFTAAVCAQAGWAADPSPSAGAPDLTKARALIKARDYRAAIVQLNGLVSTQNADVFNLMGFALRKSGDQANGMAYYQRALAIDPKHKGALEYQGALFVELGQIDRARENQAALRRLCPAVEPTSADWGSKNVIVFADRLGISTVSGDGGTCQLVVPRAGVKLLKAAEPSKPRAMRWLWRSTTAVAQAVAQPAKAHA